MQILFINGSPKGDISFTNQYINYISKNFSHIRIKKIDLSKKYRLLENTQSDFKKTLVNQIKESDGIVWAFPVYFFSVPAQYKFFIEYLIKDRELLSLLKAKYTTYILTSMNVGDNLAADYMRHLMYRLEMKFYEGISFHMFDMLTEQRSLISKFFTRFISVIEKDLIKQTPSPNIFYQEKPEFKIDLKSNNAGKKNKTFKYILVSSNSCDDSNLKSIIRAFISSSKYEIVEINLDKSIIFPCKGHINCVYNEDCLIKDCYQDVFSNEILSSDVIVFATSIVADHIHYRMKMFMDRIMPVAHHPVFHDKHFVGILSGKTRHVQYINQFFQLFSEQLFLKQPTGLITTDGRDNNDIEAQINWVHDELKCHLQNSFHRLQTFLGKATHKMVRDELYNIRFLFKSSHNFYKKHKLYDFPQKDTGARFRRYLFSLIFLVPFLRKRVMRNITKFMIKPFSKHTGI